MIRIDIKPLSINQAFKGRKFKTHLYNSYQKQLLLLLPTEFEVPEGKLEIVLTFGFSSKAADIDNPMKLFIDILQKKYLFNDNRIYKATIYKEIVKKGKEFIEFDINQI